MVESMPGSDSHEHSLLTAVPENRLERELGGLREKNHELVTCVQTRLDGDETQTMIRDLNLRFTRLGTGMIHWRKFRDRRYTLLKIYCVEPTVH
jgi:hypothetical protein